MSETDYQTGSRAAWLRMLAECIKALGPEGSAEAWQGERAEAVIALRTLCADFGLSNDWDDDLNLSDVIEKHVARSLDSESVCDGYHCTLEERALINAVLERCGSIRRNQLDGEPEIYAIIDAVEALLAARAGKEER